MPMIDVYAVAGTFPDKHQLAVDLASALMAIEHPVMLAGMLVAMLARREEYACGHQRHAVVEEAAR